jgi:signal transduction histidine kinase|tara:strand:+ start:3316 stop:4482 length:1167 start_codon:yes stop_codon:yes gene_type:complete
VGRLNLTYQKKTWKTFLFLFAILIGVLSLMYTNQLVSNLDKEERKKIELWAEATYQLVNSGIGPTNNILASRIIQENTSIPTILTNEVGEIIGERNLPKRKNQAAFLKRQLQLMKDQHEPIKIEAKMNNKIILTQYLYYKDSYILSQLRFYPFIQLASIVLFIIVAYLMFNRSRNSEQNLVWAGMAKETAHQIGTPLSSLMACVELLKSSNDSGIAEIIDKDVERLNTITERFSKIGSRPSLKKHNIFDLLQKNVDYLQNRLSEKVQIKLNNNCNDATIPLNETLMEWVIENICKNAVDAMQGEGTITINVFSDKEFVKIEISDTGMGMTKNEFKQIFEPGFTTKKRGWGLGLSLSKRIVEIYHKGKIYVRSSEKNVGTTFCISLHKN